MKMFRAIGLAIAIITLRVLAPDVWHSLETTLVMFFSTLQKAMALVPTDFLQGNAIGIPYVPMR